MLCSFAGDITQKGYEKKRAKLLGPYLSRGENSSLEYSSSAQMSTYRFS